MAHTPTEIAVGGIVLAAAIGFVAYAVQSVGGASSAGDYTLTASFRSAEGIAVGTDVRLAGVKIGTVTDMDLNRDTFRADTVMAFADGIELPDDSAVVIASEGLLGGSFLEILPGGSPFNLEPGDEIVDTQSSVSIIQLLLRFVSGEEE